MGPFRSSVFPQHVLETNSLAAQTCTLSLMSMLWVGFELPAQQGCKCSPDPVMCELLTCTQATCFAYGQTGSGKTYTMQPLPLRAAADIFR